MINKFLHNDPEHQLIFAEFFPNYGYFTDRKNIDYKRLFKLICFKHRILNHFLEQIDEQYYPEDFINKLKNQRIKHKKKTLERLYLQLEIYHLLKDYDLIFLKGLTLSQRLYNDFSYRLGSDIDFLIKPKDEAEIIRILVQNGYQKLGNQEHHYILKKKNISIEVHRKLSDIHKTNQIEKDIWQKKEYIQIKNILLPVLSSKHEYQQLLYNASVHFWTPLMLLLDYFKYQSTFKVSQNNEHSQKLEKTILDLIKTKKATTFQQKIILKIIFKPLDNRFLFLIKKALYFAQISQHPYCLSITKSFIRMVRKSIFQKLTDNPRL